MKLTHTLLLLLTFLAAQTAGAATITVTSNADNGAGTLRDALANAADGDTIDASGISGTILLTSGELLVTNSLTIVGPGPNNLAVDGNFPNTTNRVFHIGSSTVVSISSLTITNGFATGNAFGAASGGGIYNDHATLTVSNCTLSSNSASYGGGIINDGAIGSATVTIANSTLSGNSAVFGGGIYNVGGFDGSSATLTVSNCTLSSNSASYYGGGIVNDGAIGSATVTIANSTLSGNSAGGGGAIYNEDATLVIRDSTFSGNSAHGQGGGAIFNRAVSSVFGANTSSVAVLNSTLSGNSDDYFGGGIVNLSIGANATVLIANSTLSGNSASYGGSIVNSSSEPGSASVEIGNSILKTGASGGNISTFFFTGIGTITSRGYNLSSDDGGGFLTATGDQSNTDPLLGPLQDNGGPTFTHALLPGSPAINAGDANFTSPPDFDQRGPGFPRIVDGRVDIGAFEVQPPADSDGDGVPDAIDQCSDTPPGAIVNSTGCSIAQLVPCEGPRSGGTWKNHGQYVRAVVKAATDFRKAGLITRRQWAQIVKQAAHSKCGKNRHSDHDGNSERERD